MSTDFLFVNYSHLLSDRGNLITDMSDPLLVLPNIKKTIIVEF